MENDHCKIVFDKPNKTYYSGQSIFGTFTLLKYKGKKIRGVFFKVSGHGKCSWSSLKRNESAVPPNSCSTDESANENERSLLTSGEENYLPGTIYFIAGSKHGPQFQINQDEVSYSFRYNLSRVLPSTFKGSYGKIKYEMEFTIDRKWKLDKTFKVPLTIMKSLDLNYDPHAILPQQKQITRNIGIIHSGPISLHVCIPRTGFACGEKLPIQVIVTNNSSTHVEKVKFTLRQIVNYHSKAPSRAEKQEIFKILKKQAGGVEKKSEQKYEHLLDIPELPASDQFASNIIHIKYDIVVEVKISGLYKNLIEIIPITIGSVGVRNVPSIPGWNVPATNTGLDEFQSLPVLPIGLPLPSSTYPSLPSRLNNSLPPPLPQVPGAFSTSSPMVRRTAEPRRSVPNMPSAPPFDFYNASPHSTRSSICADAPPSYSEVFGSPSQQLSSSINSSMSSLSVSQPSHQDNSSSNPFETSETSVNEHRASIPPRRRRRIAELSQRNAPSTNNEQNSNESSIHQRLILAGETRPDGMDLAKKEFCNSVPVAAGP